MIFAVNKGGRNYLSEYPVDGLSSPFTNFIAWEEYAEPGDAGFSENRYFFFRDASLNGIFPLVFFERLGFEGKRDLLAEAFLSPFFKRQISLLISQEKHFRSFLQQVAIRYFTSEILPVGCEGRLYHDVRIIGDVNDPDDFIIINLLIFILSEFLYKDTSRFCVRIFLFSPEIETDRVESPEAIDLIYSNLKLFCLVKDSVECKFYINFIHSSWNHKWRSLDYFINHPTGHSSLLPGDSHKISLLIPFNPPRLDSKDLNCYAESLKKLVLVREYLARKPNRVTSPRMFFDSYINKFDTSLSLSKENKFKLLFSSSGSFYELMEKLEVFSSDQAEKAIESFYDLFYKELLVGAFVYTGLKSLSSFFKERRTFWEVYQLETLEELNEIKQLFDEFYDCGSNFIRRYFWLFSKYHIIEGLLCTVVKKIFYKKFYTAEALCSLELLCLRVVDLEQQLIADCFKYSLSLPFESDLLAEKIEVEQIFEPTQFDFVSNYFETQTFSVNLSVKEKDKIKDLAEDFLSEVYFVDEPIYSQVIKKTWRDNFFLWSLGSDFRIIYSDKFKVFGQHLKYILSGADGTGWFTYREYKKDDFSRNYALKDARVHSEDLFYIENMSDNGDYPGGGSVFIQSGFFPVEVYIYKEIKGAIAGLMSDSTFFKKILAKYSAHSVVFLLETLLEDYGFVRKSNVLENFLSLRKLIIDLPEEKFVDLFSAIIDSAAIAETEKHQVLVYFNEYLKLSAINWVD